MIYDNPNDLVIVGKLGNLSVSSVVEGIQVSNSEHKGLSLQHGKGKLGIRLSPEEEKIINLLDEPCPIDSIIQNTGFSASKVSSLLLDMELKGIIEQQAGKQFIRRY